MKMLKAFLFLTILVGSFQICFGQEKPEAYLVDEFGGITCEEQLARTDSYFVDLTNNPDSIGYVVIYPGKEKPKSANYVSSLLKGSISRRRFDKTRIIITRGKTIENPLVQFWRVPPGAEKPEPAGAELEKSVYDLTKPFVFGDEDGLSICPTFIPEDYADLINNNPNILGHLVIFNRSKALGKETADLWLKIFTEDHKVPRQKLKVFYVKGKELENTEFWIVPTKKN